jgi:hypothetical protein
MRDLGLFMAWAMGLGAALGVALALSLLPLFLLVKAFNQ